MNYLKSVGVIAIMLLLFTECKKDAVTEVAEEKVPMADFTFSKSEYLSGETIELTNTSTDAETVRWTLPDGITSKSNSVSFPTQTGLLDYWATFRLDAISKSGTKSDYVVKKIFVKQPKGKLIVYASIFTDGTQGYLSIGDENKGLITLKSANGPINCGDSGYSNYDVSVGPTTVRFVTLSGSTRSFNITIGLNQCTKLELN